MAKRKLIPRWCEECHCQMVYDSRQNRYICPKCHGFWTPGDKNDDYVERDIITSLMYELKRTHKAIDCLPSGPPAKGGGGGHTKGRKQPSKKKSVNQLYKEL
jgi:hypothetical protein